VKTGTIAEFQEKGRIKILVLDIDGEKHEIKLIPKLTVDVVAPGDAGFIRPDVLMQGQGEFTNNRIFLEEINIYIPEEGKKLSAGGAKKAPPAVGQAGNVYIIGGPVVSAAIDEDYPTYTQVVVKSTKQIPPAVLENDKFKVWVHRRDITIVPVGTEVELTIKPLRGDKFLPLGVKVTLEDPLESEEFFAEEDAKKDE